jgi:formamidopyrimidine-DNA glycosylase
VPELPEVETVVLSIRDQLVGQKFININVRWPKVLFNFSKKDFLDNLVQRKITNVHRRGKFIVLSFDEDILAIHLRMTGKLYFAYGKTNKKHISASMKLDNGQQLVFEDTRKFGRFYYYTSQDIMDEKLGIEPLGDFFTADWLIKNLHCKKRMIKALLLDQRIIAGLGNIYVDECLWQSRIHPETRSNKISKKNISTLCESIRNTLQLSIAAHGTTVVNFSYLNGRSGKFSNQLQVFGKDGQPCTICATEIKKKWVAGRGTHFCPKCQKKRY